MFVVLSISLSLQFLQLIFTIIRWSYLLKDELSPFIFPKFNPRFKPGYTAIYEL